MGLNQMRSSSGADDGDFHASLYSTGQKAILAALPVITGCLSVTGSSTIVFIVLNDRKRKLRHVYHRLMLGMSVFDIFYSAALAASVLMVPKGDPYSYGGQGNLATCETQGFFMTLGITVYLYNMCLSIYYLLSIRYEVKDRSIACCGEKLMHFVCVCYPLSFAFVALAFDMFNPMEKMSGWCYLTTTPNGCGEDPDVDCVRGSPRTKLIARWGSLTPFALTLSVIAVCMLLIYDSVRRQERKARTRSSCQGLAPVLYDKSMKRTRQTFQQSALYVGAMFFTVIFTAPATMDNMSSRYYFVFVVLVKIFLPLQGFWNLLIYIRPRYMALRPKFEGDSSCTILRAVVLSHDRTKVETNLRRRRSSAMMEIEPTHAVDSTNGHGGDLRAVVSDDRLTPELTDSRQSNDGTDEDAVPLQGISI